MVLPNSLSSYYEKFLTTGEVKCIDEEIPFEIPKGWEWTRIRNISQSYIGLTYSPTDVSSRGTIVLRSSNIQNGKIVLNDVVRVSKEISEKLQVEKNDIIICARNGSAKLVGKSAVVTDVTEPMTFGAFMAICKTALYQYVSIFLQSDLFFSQLRGVSGTTTINQLTQNNFNDFWIPIPPANEQKRIVEKLQNVSPFIERYSKSQETLNLMNIQIKEQLKKSILQEAIQGKLVPQIAEEGTAQELLEQIRQEKQKLVKEGKLKKSVLTDSVIYKGDDNKYWEKYGTETICVNDEIPFEIPATWIWVRLDNICSYIQRGKSPKYSPIKKYPVIAQKCNQWAGFCIDKAQFIDPNSLPSYSEERLLQDGDLMWNSTGLGTLGRMAIYQSALNPYELAVADSHVTVIRPLKEHILSQYLYYYFASDTVQSVIEDKSDGSTKQKELSTTTVKNYLVPIPPYREQQRIVEKIKTVTSIMRG
ncbi:type I restriction modification DNA specificity domain protein [Phocaeicola plebeius DSM 17135]|uniref:Type I restriction modification DNA specificity domain protein n=1 Tax=Phocaeicola plebeius (strain DSM 17135 / JCM 12973 / CCUG 54634 / M2) TaxID=484018 RepID=B5D2Q5_PHOPM|nr:restriction endonuclease subunit S [Phocaeicola plebeius]EDY93855.1 type I restriction modification DNA specificity domain protein [Phocaeicola plebeius DSM 17135]